MTHFADPRTALAICDDCGLRWQRSQLKRQVIAGRSTALLHCPDCLDIDNQQLLLGRIHNVSDPNPVYDPRPDPSLVVARSGYGSDPVSNIGLTINCYPMTEINDVSIAPTIYPKVYSAIIWINADGNSINFTNTSGDSIRFTGV